MNNKPSILPFVLVVTIPIGIFLAAIGIIITLSVAVWSTVQTQDFISSLSAPMGESFANYRRAQIRPRAIPLVAMLNEMDVYSPQGNSRAEDNLLQLILLSGKDFGTKFKGTEKKHTWNPPDSPEAWGKTMTEVNEWADENFGTDFSYRPPPETRQPRYEPDDPHPEIQPDFSEPPATYELPEERERPSYTPPPQDYEPPPSYDNDNNYDTGGVIDPYYDREDGFQPDD